MDSRTTARIGIRMLLGAALWIGATAIVALVWLGLQDPQTATRLATQLGRAAVWIASVLVAVGGLGCLLWPPSIPAARLWLRRMRDRMSVDQGPMRAAVDRLKHFESAPDHVAVGRTWLRMGQAPRAIPHLARAVELEPDLASAGYLLGQALLDVGATREAATVLGNVVAIDPDHAFGDAMLALGRALERAGEHARAEQVLSEHEQRFGPNRTADYLRARIALAGGARDRARTLLERAAAEPRSDERLAAPDALVRAQARVALLRVGGRR